jgi:hypothetical protein
MLDHICGRGWAKRVPNSRVVTFTKTGAARFEAMMLRQGLRCVAEPNELAPLSEEQGLTPVCVLRAR